MKAHSNIICWMEHIYQHFAGNIANSILAEIVTAALQSMGLLTYSEQIKCRGIISQLST